MTVFHSTKTYGHDVGLSCAFRQWRADSHCNLLHGYALAVHLDFAAIHLDDRNWVVDFGALKVIKQELADNFDHKTVVAGDDPELDWFREAHKRKIIDLIVTDAVGCERFALMVSRFVNDWLARQPDLKDRVQLRKVEVREHAGNSAYIEFE